MSADMPGVIVPVVNHFLIGRSEHTREGLETSVGAMAAMYLPDGGRRTAASVAKDFAWRLEASACQGDCLIDCFSYFSQKPRNPIAWEEIREEIALEMDSIAASIEISGNPEWEACFKLCGEDAVGQSLMSGPYDPDAAPEFSGPCPTGATDASGATASSSSGATAACTSPLVYGMKPHDDVQANVDTSVKDEPTVTGTGRKLLWNDADGNRKATAASSSSDAAGATAASGSSDAAKTACNRRGGAPGKGRSTQLAKYMTRVSKEDPPSNPDDALVQVNPDDALAPCVSSATSGARTVLDLVAAGVENVGGSKQNFEQWMGSLPADERTVLTSSYIQYAAAEREWTRNMGGVANKKRKCAHLSGNALNRIQRRAVIKQTVVHDRMAVAREYICYLGAGAAEGQVNSKISAQTSKADFIRTVLMSDRQRATADNNSL